jgi:uncharacterized membrane protein
VPFLEGEAAAAIGVIGGLHPLVAAAAAIVGNLGCVALVVLLSSRIRTFALARKSSRAVELIPAPGLVTATAGNVPTRSTIAPTLQHEVATQLESKGRQKARRWLARFGLPGATMLGPLAIPTHFTAVMFVAAGFTRRRVLLWQALAIIFWTSVATTSGTIAVALFPVS